MLSGGDDGLGGGLSCPEKDRCTKCSCTGGGLSSCFQGVDKWFPWPAKNETILPVHVVLKRRSTIILHGSTTQKTALNIILAAVRTWNLTNFSISPRNGRRLLACVMFKQSSRNIQLPVDAFGCCYAVGQRFPNCGRLPQGALLVLWRGASCLCEGYIYFERNMCWR
jgi:hypothetical protein